MKLRSTTTDEPAVDGQETAPEETALLPAPGPQAAVAPLPSPPARPTGVSAALLAATRDRFATGTHETVSQTRLVLMCFERIARDLQTAQEALGAGRLADTHTNLVHAQDIIMVLRDALDADAWSGAGSLLAVYDWSISQLVLANSRKDVSMIAAVASALAEIGAGFEEASRAARPAINVPSAGLDTGSSGLSVKA